MGWGWRGGEGAGDGMRRSGEAGCQDEWRRVVLKGKDVDRQPKMEIVSVICVGAITSPRSLLRAFVCSENLFCLGCGPNPLSSPGVKAMQL